MAHRHEEPGHSLLRDIREIPLHKYNVMKSPYLAEREPDKVFFMTCSES